VRGSTGHNPHINTHTKVDSGADVSCIDWGFIRKNRIPTERLPKLINLQNADGSINTKGKILFVAPLFFRIGRITQKVHFFVMSCRNENIILGLPWLKEANPNIDWEKESLTLDDKIDQSKELVKHHNVQNVTQFNPSGTYYKPQDRKGLFNHLDYEEPEPFTVQAVKAWAWETILQASLIKWPNNAEI